jgi:aldehyde:ferredoxin oxidoreductase
MPNQSIQQMREAHEVLGNFEFDAIELEKGYANRTLRIDLNNNNITIQPVTQQMKDLWVGGKGFDLWLMFQEIDKNTKWDSPQNPICFSPGPLG